MYLGWCIFVVSGCVIVAVQSMPFVDEVSPVASAVCRCFSSVADSSEGRLDALEDAFTAIENAGSNFEYHVRTETVSLQSWMVFIGKVQRLEYLIDQFQIYKDSEVTDSERLEFAVELLDLGADGLSNVLHSIHAGVVGSSVTSSHSIYAIYSRSRRGSGSDYLLETLRFVTDLINLQTLGYTAGTWACTIKNNFSCFDHFSSLLTDRMGEQDLYLMRKRIYAFSAPNVQTSFNWCSCDSCRPIMGDVNGDRRSDLMCFKAGGSSRMTTFDTSLETFRDQDSRWSPTDESCEADNIFVGYFNRDRRSDVLCLNRRSRDNKMRLIYSASSGRIGSTTGWRGDHEFVTLCLDNPSETALFTGDFNGDGRTDILCQNHVNGHMRITHQPTTPVLFTWRWTILWCRTPSTRLYVGDFNGDRREDLLCHNWRTGRSSLKLASSRGTFMSDISWRGSSAFCQGGSMLHVGDFNGDRKSDLLCYTYRRNARDTVKIVYANRNGDFANSRIVTLDMDWCGTSDVRLRQVADVNGDGRDDLVCYGRDNKMRVGVNSAYLYF